MLRREASEASTKHTRPRWLAWAAVFGLIELSAADLAAIEAAFKRGPAPRGLPMN